MHNGESSRREMLGTFAAMLGATVIAPSVLSAHARGDLHTSDLHNNADAVEAKLLLEKELAGFPGQQVTVTQVSYPPGLESQPHKHHGPVFVYVVEGVMELQVSGGAVTTVKAGETFYEPPGGTHVVSRNASKTKPAKLVAFIVGKAGTPVTGPPAAE